MKHARTNLHPHMQVPKVLHQQRFRKNMTWNGSLEERKHHSKRVRIFFLRYKTWQTLGNHKDEQIYYSDINIEWFD